MKKVLLAVMVFAMSSFAQIGLDAALDVAMPIGDAADFTNLGAGVSVKGYFPINEQVDITGRAGYLYWFPGEIVFDFGSLGKWTTEYNYAHIPVMAGARYKFTPEFYGMAEAGMTFWTFTSETTVEGVSGSTKYDDSGSEFGFGVGAGYIMNALDFSISYNTVDDWNSIVLRIGYKFM